MKPGNWYPSSKLQKSIEEIATVLTCSPDQVARPTSNSPYSLLQSPLLIKALESNIPNSSPGSRILIDSENITAWETPVSSIDK